ncbi:MAG: AEC family transporter [Thermodesulfobacteriota bacterium]|jgi:predicted permease|uniref:AEC family transporter n=1 Tax=Syntrophotalea sp. TaxID=2812029 RepID=UPI002A9535D2|nr:AEC family transporter [Thermodesulfobacteriota bacterium]
MLFVQVVLPVFLIVCAGIVLEKTARLDFRTLTISSLYVFCPALVFSALMKREFELTLAGDLFLFMVLYTAALYGFSWLIARMAGFDRESRSALLLTTVMMNVGNFGLPLTYFAFGEAALEVSVLTFVLFNIPLGTLAIVIAQGSKGSLSTALLNMAKIPIFHGVVLAFLFKMLQWVPPTFVLRPIDLVGQAAIPVMLLMLGMQLARTRWQNRVGFLSLATLTRLAASPLLAWGLTALLDIKGLARSVVILQTSTPSAVLPLLYALRFGVRPDLVAGTILTTTLVSAGTLTLLLYLLTP